jgi:hypothetical protein
MSTYPQFVTVYRVVGWSDEVCSLGMRHKLAVYAQKALRLTDKVRVNHALPRGYSDAELVNPIYVDTQGRIYNTYMAVDFHATRRYEDKDGNTWVARKPEGLRVDEFEKRKTT